MIDKIVQLLASLGIPGVVLAIAMVVASASGLTGAAVLTAALAALGGPGGMIGGIALLLLLSSVGAIGSEKAFEEIAKKVIFIVKDKMNLTCEGLIDHIRTRKISKGMKLKILAFVEENCED